jgi:hypothetical protein
VVDQGKQPVVEAGDVQDADRLAVQPELRPGDHLEQLLERAEAAREGDHGVRQLGHQRLPLVHALHDSEVGQAVVGELFRGERLGDDARHLAAGPHRRVRHDPHQAHAPAAVDQADVALRQQLAQTSSLLRVLGP